MPVRLTADSRSCLRAAETEARRVGGRQIGTDHLLLGLLHDPRGSASHALGVDLAAARAAYDALDRSALAAVGITAPDDLNPARRAGRGRTTLSAGARGVLSGAVREAGVSGSRRITPEHLLVSIVERDHPDPAATLLHALGVDPSAVRTQLRRAG